MYNSQDYKRCICQTFKDETEYAEEICPYEFDPIPEPNTDSDSDDDDDIDDGEDFETDSDQELTPEPTDSDLELVIDNVSIDDRDVVDPVEEESELTTIALPYFSDFDPQRVYEVTIGEELVVQLSEIVVSEQILEDGSINVAVTKFSLSEI